MSRIVGLMILVSLVAGCGGTGVRSSNFDKVTLKPGDSAVCVEQPCAVHFVMPPGEGKYVIKGVGVFAEEWPAGQTVFLGSYWQGTYSFEVVGTDAPIAYLGVGGDPN